MYVSKVNQDSSKHWFVVNALTYRYLKYDFMELVATLKDMTSEDHW